MIFKKVLLIPDVYVTGESGALVANTLAQYLIEMGCQVGVLSHDVFDEIKEDVTYYRKELFTTNANYFSNKHKDNFDNVLVDFNPDVIFSVGGVINRPVFYFDVIKQKNIKHVYLIFCQDFYCARIHAALSNGPCTVCLTGSQFNAVKNKCGIKTSRNQLLFLINGGFTRTRLKSRLQRLDFVLGSSDEQLGFYREWGIENKKIVKMPLFFPEGRLLGIKIERGNYFIIAAQNRIEKGIHLLQRILPYVNTHLKIKIIFSRETEGRKALFDYGLDYFVQSGMLEPVYNVSWGNGLEQLVAKSRGVLITSIWPTTTEFALLEALGMQKPVICFNVGIHGEIFVNERNGFTFPINAFEQFGKAINRLSLEDELYNEISQASLDLYNELTDKTKFHKILQSII